MLSHFIKQLNSLVMTRTAPWVTDHPGDPCHHYGNPLLFFFCHRFTVAPTPTNPNRLASPTMMYVPLSPLQSREDKVTQHLFLVERNHNRLTSWPWLNVTTTPRKPRQCTAAVCTQCTIIANNKENNITNKQQSTNQQTNNDNQQFLTVVAIA